jgi:hypothetical protein
LLDLFLEFEHCRTGPDQFDVSVVSHDSVWAFSVPIRSLFAQRSGRIAASCSTNL